MPCTRFISALYANSATSQDQTPVAAAASSSTLQEPQIERSEHQDNSDVHHQPFPEPVLKEQDVHADNHGYQREHVKHDDCLSSHPAFLVRAAEWSQRNAWRLSLSSNVRFGSKADMCIALTYVRFTPENGMSAKGQKRTSGHYGRSGSNAAMRGKITLISVNAPGCVSTSIEPPCCFTMMS